MHESVPKILVVESDSAQAESLLDSLDAHAYRVASATDVARAWDQLEREGDAIDVVLINRSASACCTRKECDQLLQRIKAHPMLQSVPVVLVTDTADNNETLRGVRAGAYCVLHRPFEDELISDVTQKLVQDRRNYRFAHQERRQTDRVLGLLQQGNFRFRTLEAARDLAGVLANTFPNPRIAVVGLSELFINAVEHGNLDIRYEEKSHLREQNEWEQEVTRRMQMPVYADRWVSVHYRRTEEAIEVVVIDQGQGFDWRKYMQIDPERAFDLHGRGIALARMLSFDRVEYRGVGNEVAVSVRLNQSA